MANTLLHHLLKSRHRPSHHIAVKVKYGRKWIQYTWPQVYNLSCRVAQSLDMIGLEPRDRIGIFADTCFEWLLTDLGILGFGGVSVPIYASSRSEEVEFIINDSQVKVLFCDSTEQANKFFAIKDRCPTVEKVVCFQVPKENNRSIETWNDFLKIGDKNDNGDHWFKEACESTSLDQLATIIYTSGTTGTPKGVMLSHRQIMSELSDLFSCIPVDHRDCTLTFLPFAHVMGRVEGWGAIYAGYTLAFAESIDKLRANMSEIRPTLLIAVPRIFEKIFNAVVTQVETSPLRKRIFNWALSVGQSLSQARAQNRSPGWLKLVQDQMANRVVFRPFQEKLGGRLRFAISGGAPLEKKVAEFFHAAGVLILEGYGLTETTAATCINTPFDYEFGTVGSPMKDVEVKIAEDGEILILSDKVMMGYFNNDEATREVMRGGFFATGDIGEWTEGGHLRITDRKKDLIKTSGGKYVAPQKLENALKMNPYISQALIHGDQRKYIVALITLEEENIKKFASEHSISFQNIASLSKSPQVRALIRDAVAELNSELASYETIKSFDILPRDFTIEDSELTPSLKIRRKFCDQKFKDRLDKLYGIDKSTI